MVANEPHSRLLFVSITLSMEIICNELCMFHHLSLLGVRRVETSPNFIVHLNGTPNYNPFIQPLLLIITLEEMTIKHSTYMQKVPLYYTERAWFFLVLKFALAEKFCHKKCCEYFGPDGVLFMFPIFHIISQISASVRAHAGRPDLNEIFQLPPKI